MTHQVVANLGDLSSSCIPQVHYRLAHEAQQRLGGTNSQITTTALQGMGEKGANRGWGIWRATGWGGTGQPQCPGHPRHWPIHKHLAQPQACVGATTLHLQRMKPDAVSLATYNTLPMSFAPPPHTPLHTPSSP
jgi:hypothetical protein